jgi:hypothetical protein
MRCLLLRINAIKVTGKLESSGQFIRSLEKGKGAYSFEQKNNYQNVVELLPYVNNRQAIPLF